MPRRRAGEKTQLLRGKLLMLRREWAGSTGGCNGSVRHRRIA